MMISCKTFPLITAFILALACYSHTLAGNSLDDRYDDEPPAERFKIRIGGFIIDSF